MRARVAGCRLVGLVVLVLAASATWSPVLAQTNARSRFSSTEGIVLNDGEVKPYNVSIDHVPKDPGGVNVITSVRTQLVGDRVVGLVRNDTDHRVFDTRVLIACSDASGNSGKYLTAVGKTFRSYLDPGEIQPFEADSSCRDSFDYNLSVYSLPGDGQAEFSHRDLTAEITDKSR